VIIKKGGRMEAKKILVVDDDLDFVKLLSRHISREGYNVIAAFDGYQAIRLAHTENPDLIVLDIRLPAGGGIGTLKNLRNSSQTINIPIIIVTAYDNAEVKKEASEYNVEEYMVKPFDPKELIEKIWKYI